MQMWKQNRNHISRFSNLSICVIICYSPLPCLVRWSASDCYLLTAAGPFNNARDPNWHQLKPPSSVAAYFFLKKKYIYFSSFFYSECFVTMWRLKLFGFMLSEHNIFRHTTHCGFSWLPTTKGVICLLVFSLFMVVVTFGVDSSSALYVHGESRHQLVHALLVVHVTRWNQSLCFVL